MRKDSLAFVSKILFVLFQPKVNTISMVVERLHLKRLLCVRSIRNWLIKAYYRKKRYAEWFSNKPLYTRTLYTESVRHCNLFNSIQFIGMLFRELIWTSIMRRLERHWSHCCNKKAINLPFNGWNKKHKPFKFMELNITCTMYIQGDWFYIY